LRLDDPARWWIGTTIHADDPNKCVLFHCGNWAKSFFDYDFKMGYAPILGSALGDENTFGIVEGRTPPGPLSYARVSTDDRHGVIKAYVGDGMFVNDPLDTFGSCAVVEVPNLQTLMRYLCKNGFEHHAAMNQSHSAPVLCEAFETYFDWKSYQHN
jgi:L-fucose isomerase-like protein